VCVYVRAHVFVVRTDCKHQWDTVERAPPTPSRASSFLSPPPFTPPPQDIEEGLVKRDLKRQRLQETHDAPSMVARMNELHDTTLARRGKMMLPAPQAGCALL
jgi:hypothetical protein